jgi:hypothetical protein
MQIIHIEHNDSALDYHSAERIAKDVARKNQIGDPTILAWHRTGSTESHPNFDGANPDTWWEKYGSGNGGALEIEVGNDYQFVVMDADGYETLGDMPLRNISDNQGNHYLCIKPILKQGSDKPTPEACTLLDGWYADQY